MKFATAGYALAAVSAFALAFAACGDSGNTSVAGHVDSGVDAGGACTSPLAITGLLAPRPFPEGVDMVGPSGDPAEIVVEGGIGAVRSDNGGWDLAMRVGNKPVRLPDSNYAAHVIADEFPGTPYKLLVFSRASMKPVGSFAGRTLLEPDKSSWSLEVQLIDTAGRVAASSSLRHPGDAVVPFDLDVTLGVRSAAVLVQWDKRGYLDSRARGDETSSPTAMQVVEITLDATGKLGLAEGPRETLTRRDLQTLISERIHVPTCEESADTCGPIPTGKGDFVDCGGCAVGKVCQSNRCVQADGCVASTRAELCTDRACGKRYDGCGAVVDCGGCGPGLECGGGEEVGKCADPFALSASDVRGQLGPSVCGCFADSRGTPVTVECPKGQSCENSICVGTPTPDPNAPELLDASASTFP